MSQSNSPAPAGLSASQRPDPASADHRCNFMRIVCRLVLSLIIGSLIPLSAYAQPARQQGKGYPVEPLDLEKLQRPDYEKLATSIERLSLEAAVYHNASKELDAAFDGTPRQARKIIAVKLQVLENLAYSLPLTIGSIEEFQITSEAMVARWANQKKTIVSQVQRINSDIEQLADVVEKQGLDQVDAGLKALLAKKLQRRDDLARDVDQIAQLNAAAQRSMAQVRKLQKVILTFGELTKEESLRQRDSLLRNRLAKQSELVHLQAASLAKTVRAVEQAVNQIPDGGADPVIPTQPPEIELVELTLTPEAQARVEEFFKSRQK